MSGSIRVQANGQTLAVNFTRTNGAAASVFSDAGLTSAVSLPATISSDTYFYFPTPETYVVSVKLNGVEIASNAGGTLTQFLHGNSSTTIAPSVDGFTERAAVDAGAFPSRLGGTSTTAAPLVNLNVKDFGATGDGVTDDQAAIQAAHDALIARGGGVLDFPAGTYYLNGAADGIQAKRNLTAATAVILQGTSGTTIKLGATAQQFLGFTRTVEGDAWQFYTVQDFTVDASAVVIGAGVSYVVGGSWTRVHVRDLVFRRVRITNLPINQSGSPAGFSQAFAVKVSDDGTFGSTLEVKRLLFEDCRVDGGNNGFEIAGYNAGTTAAVNTITVDDITVLRCRHDTGVTPTAAKTSENLLIGGSAVGGRCVVRDFRGYNSLDAGIEIDSMQDSVVDSCYIEDSFNNAYLFSTYNQPASPRSQVATFRNCRAVRNAVTTMKGFRTAGATYAAPRLVFDTCVFRAASGLPTGSNAHAWELNSPARDTILRNCQAITENQAVATGASANPKIINYLCAPAVAGTPSRLLVDGFAYHASGTTGTSGSNNHDIVSIGPGADVFLDVRGVVVTDEITRGATSVGYIAVVNLNPASTATVRGTVRNCSVQSMGNGTCVTVGGTSVLTLPGVLVVEDCDFSKGASGWVTVTGFANGSQNKDKVALVRCRSNPTAANASITVSASPFTYQNLDGYEEIVTTSGGTVSQIDVSADGTTFVTTGQLAGAIRLSAGQAVKVTYSVAPTMTKIPVTGR